MGLLSSLFGGSKTTKTTQTPWGPQAQALQYAFNQAQDLYGQKAGTPWYQGQLVAPLDPLTSAGISSIGDYATGAGAAAAGQVGGSASDLLSGSTDPFLASIGAYGQLASTDPTSGNISDATQYINNPLLQAQIDAIGSDISRNLNENTLPAIDRAAVGTGNINSSRTGVAEGIAERGAQQDLANEAALIRANAYQNGLNLAEQGREYNLGSLGNIPGMYGQGIRMGMTGSELGQGMTLEDLNAMIQAGQLNQQQAQNIDNANLYSWQQNDQRDAQLLQQMFGIVGSNNWGGTQTTKTSGGNGILSDLLGVGLTAAGLFGTGGAFPGAFGLFGGGGQAADAGLALGLMG